MLTIRTIMMSAAGGLALLTTGVADAAHDCRRAVHAEYEANVRRVNYEFETRKRALHAEHRSARDCVMAEIRHVERTLCGEERALALRALHDKRQRIDRRHHRQVRAVHRTAEQQRRALNDQRDDALLSCRTGCSHGNQPHAARSYHPAPYSRHARDDFTGRPYAGARPNPHPEPVRSPLQLLFRELLAGKL